MNAFAQDWTVVTLSAVVAFLAIGGMFATSRLLSSRRRSEAKLTTYECGIPATEFSWSNISLRFYIFAIMFLIFDVEAVFLFPWAVVFLEQKNDFGNPVPFYAMLLFLGVLFLALIYAWRKGVLEWQK
jgi:NADH-quinone oxidoreductase subunit A